MDAVDTAMLVLRVWLGVVMLLHGINHARSLDGTTGWFGSIGFRQPRLNATLSAYGEIAIGVGILTGFLTSVAALGLVATMTVAFGAIHRFVGFFVFKRPDEGYEYVGTLAVGAIALATVGAGSASLDNAIGIDDSLDGWAGLIIAAAGLVVGAAQLAIFWRPPAPKSES